MTRLLATLAVATILLVFGCFPTSAQVWDLSRDFSGTINPNGPWAFGSSADAHTAIELYTSNTAVPAQYATTQLFGWSDPNIGVTPYVAKNISATNWNYDGTGAGGGPAVLKPGEVLLHPSSNPQRFTVVRWTAPRAGIFRVRATFTRFEDKPAFNSDYFVMKNGVDLPGGTGLLTGFGAPDSTATFVSGELALNMGDTISFAVGIGSDGTSNTDGNTLSATVRSVDGVNDLIFQNQTDRRIALLAVDGTTVVSSAGVFPTLPENWRVAAAADFDGDGHRDIVVQNTLTRAISILVVKGNSILASVPVKPVLPPDWQLRAAGDIDGNGQADLVVQNTSSHRIAVLLMNGMTLTQSGSFSQGLTAGWRVVGTGDFNGDGKVDLVVQNSSTRRISILTLNGRQITGSVALYPTLPENWLVGGVGDYNSDGKPDLLVQNSSTFHIAVLAIANFKMLYSASIRPGPPAGWVLVGPR
jgi:hypothetical protein